jgi:hypothetical protein
MSKPHSRGSFTVPALRRAVACVLYVHPPLSSPQAWTRAGGSKTTRSPRARPQVFLTRRPEEILTAIHGLCDALRAPFTAARDLALAEPRLLLATPAQVSEQLAALRALLPDAPRAASAVAAANPGLLLPPHPAGGGGGGAELRAVLTSLAAELGVGVSAVAAAAASNPLVLSSPPPPGSAAAALAALRGGGLGSQGRVLDVLLAQPALLYANPQVGIEWREVFRVCFVPPAAAKPLGMDSMPAHSAISWPVT